MPTLNLEFLEHQKLSILGNERLIEESICEVLCVCLDEYVTTVEAAEQANDGVESRVSLLVIHALQPLLQLVVAVGGHVVGGQRALVHEVLERHVAVPLETDVVLETLLHHQVDLSLES